MAGLLNIGLTGLGAAQAQLITTGHNITNAGVAGYHRQSVTQSNATPNFSGVGFFGQGTQITSISRSYNQFLENQVLVSSTKVAEYTAYNDQISQINNLLADAGSGLSPVIEGFFAGVQEVASNPTSIAARQSLISSAEALVSRFQTMDARLTEIRDGVEGEIDATVRQINMYAGAIAEMNQRIAQAQVAGPNVQANDLLDQRDQLVSELNKLVKTSSVMESDGSLSVFIGSGQGLVVGGVVTQLGVVPDPNDPRRLAVGLQAEDGRVNVMPESLLQGGALGGLLNFRKDSLDVAQNSLGLIALGMAEAFNAQHALGVDLDGVLGLPGDSFFKSPVPVLNPAITSVGVDIEDYSRLTAADYLVEWTGTGYTILGSAGRVALAEDPAMPGTYLYDGMRLTLSDPPPADFPGNGLLIQPTRYAARDITVGINDPRKVAAGSPVSVEAPLSNQGTAAVASISVESVAGMSGGPGNHFDSFRMRFDGSNMVLEVYDTVSSAWVGAPADYTLERQPGGGSAYDPAADSAGVSFRIAHTDGWAFSFQAKGAPLANDSFEFAPTAAGVADNRNAVALGALQTSRTMLAGGGDPTATFQSVYAQTVTQVGNKTREVQVNLAAQESLLDQATDKRDALSGVNLDEEAANLIRYQQAYQASAKIMTVAQTLFNEVLAIAR